MAREEEREDRNYLICCYFCVYLIHAMPTHAMLVQTLAFLLFMVECVAQIVCVAKFTMDSSDNNYFILLCWPFSSSLPYSTVLE